MDAKYEYQPSSQCVGDNDNCWEVVKTVDGIEDTVAICCTESLAQFLCDKLNEAANECQMSQVPSTPEFVLCQDCLRVLAYTDDRHNGVERCPCGGQLCGCNACCDTIASLQRGERGPIAGLKCHVVSWTPEHGAEVQSP